MRKTLSKARNAVRTLANLPFRNGIFTLHSARHAFYCDRAFKKEDIRQDELFGPLARRVIDDGRTLLREDRLYMLFQSLLALGDEPAAVVEVGSFRGGSAYFIGSILSKLGRRNDLFVFDTFRGHAVTDAARDAFHTRANHFLGTSAEDVSAYLSEIANVRVVEGNFLETCSMLEDRPIAFAHVDVDVYPVTRFALDFLGDRLVSGGHIVVDDYKVLTCPGVTAAVSEFLESRAGFQLVHLLTGQALILKV